MKPKTSQRTAIESVFNQSSQPLSVDEILARGREMVSTLNQSTVYRNLKLLVEQGWLKQIHHPERGTLYERRDKTHHHLFHCRVCNRVFDLPGCVLDPSKTLPSGFIIEEHEVFLSGVCRDCSD